MRPKKKWGQNFLRNRGAVEKIVAAIEPRPGEVIVEIGPGEGVLTEKLATLGNEVIAIEIDPDLASRLRMRLPGVEVRNEDALETAFPTRPFRAVGNLPYNVGTPILRRVIADGHLRRAVFMLQKEVAQRLSAKPREEQYGFLTLYAQLFATARIVLTLGPKSFHPQPKVDSAVVVLDPHPPPADHGLLIDLISAAFRMRRKKLVNNLTAWPRQSVLRALGEAGLAEGVRAEEMTLAEFQRLLERLPR
ncbi:MAG TPA: 16S rRNA (adenine(1518)-N(6)/adenine(1519)-N(6))-dimethyltransferase RsmA [Thermoanaerobaculia bacterium]|nr:16S rRNA (adenine(1518)-N(6)/adenine(1519)-N(6))-dimethyltransferase RsmA [Thermoanaerobaculia bacterium]